VDSNFQYAGAVKLVVAPLLTRPVAWDGSAAGRATQPPPSEKPKGRSGISPSRRDKPGKGSFGRRMGCSPVYFYNLGPPGQLAAKGLLPGASGCFDQVAGAGPVSGTGEKERRRDGRYTSTPLFACARLGLIITNPVPILRVGSQRNVLADSEFARLVL
jgi:hypothetical protein